MLLLLETALALFGVAIVATATTTLVPDPLVAFPGLGAVICAGILMVIDKNSRLIWGFATACGIIGTIACVMAHL